MKAVDLASYMDTILNTTKIADASQNGLQVDSDGDITTAAFAVDASFASIEKAIAGGAQILIVHHGIFWDKPLCATGIMYLRLKTLIENGCALYASHLPLDLHPALGNNAQIASMLNLQNIVPFGNYHGVTIGFGGELSRPLTADELGAELSVKSGEPCRIYSNTKESKRIAVISGGGASLLEEAASLGYDTFVTGESSHQSFHTAAENNMNLIFGGHYATETFGVKALMAHLHKELDFKTFFIDLPTGM